MSASVVSVIVDAAKDLREETTLDRVAAVMILGVSGAFVVMGLEGEGEGLGDSEEEEGELGHVMDDELSPRELGDSHSPSPFEPPRLTLALLF